MPSIATPSSPSISRPLLSSPLAPRYDSSSSPQSSPLATVQARRRQQYKSQGNSSLPPLGSSAYSRRNDQGRYKLFEGATGTEAFLRERLKAKCFDRAMKARERELHRRRYISDTSSDGIDIDMDAAYDTDDDGEAQVAEDEIFRRIIANERRKIDHSYKVSFEREVGSSLDPDMFEDFEEDLSKDSGSQFPSQDGGGAEMPEDFDLTDEELASLFEEYEKEREQDVSTSTTEQEANDQVSDFEDDFLWPDGEDIDFCMS